MPDYKEMYLHLFRETTKAISILQKVQQETEELYVSDDRASNLVVMETDDENLH